MASRSPATVPAPPRSARPPLSPADWIADALALLADQGIDAVRVDVLARRLGVTRGSFYWHFADRDALLRGLLETWRQQATEQVIARFDGSRAEPQALLRELISLPFRGAPARRAACIELAIRGWARRHPMARQAVDEVDERRIGYHAQVFSALGFPIGEARARAHVLYAYEVAESVLAVQGSAAQQAQRRALVEALIQQPLAPPGEALRSAAARPAPAPRR
ncbi:TetR/AcrR family transcriptional regulator [Piscinibacter sakaiensis]|uniref:Transcriptional regulator, TetR family n=1 Tax=Piscinibacter sakaiensis TaxID=1547922 RepID=A0A0K8P3M1_PISS1|nr:TetR/AcrR family transcriptional regulator [Piscinibacter sakaiensis]GAP37238.1 transcriptional regulator, TetR family [Piscinibacter sakaiensis]